jgi:hypothetical protein
MSFAAAVALIVAIWLLIKPNAGAGEGPHAMGE